jgi:hypothetical protein
VPFLLKVTTNVGIAVHCAYSVIPPSGIVKLVFFVPPVAAVNHPLNVNPERLGVGMEIVEPKAPVFDAGSTVPPVASHVTV